MPSLDDDSTANPATRNSLHVNEKEFKEIIQGKQRSLVATLIRGLLYCFQPVYWLGWQWDQWRQLRNQARVKAPVVSIGNITTGGTGKTPMVHFICQWFLDRKKTPVILSRGYSHAADSNAPNDEWQELRLRLPGVVHLQNRNRVAIARAAVEEHEPDVLVLDDGFQHRRLARDVDVVLIDVTNPFGHGHLLPRGLLREPLRQLSLADTLILTRCEQVNESELKRIESELRLFNAEAPIFRSKFEPSGLVDLKSGKLPLDFLRGKSVFAFAGIGNPENFFESLRQMDLLLSTTKSFPDHHEYSSDDFSGESLEPAALSADVWICTLKDLVKVKELKSLKRPIVALEIEMKIEGDWDALFNFN